MQFGIVGSGSWATALAKILTDNKKTIHWWVRSEKIIDHINHRQHNPNYLSSVYFNKELLHLHRNVSNVFDNADCVVIAVPSAYAMDTLRSVGKESFKSKKIVSAIKEFYPKIICC